MNLSEMPPVSVLEERIGYHFQNQYLLLCALTHTSYANEQKIHKYESYERLEFLGDAVLELVSSAFLYHKYPDEREGKLSKIRSVSEEVKSRLAGVRMIPSFRMSARQ